MGLAVAGFLATLGWSDAIGGDWNAQSQVAVNVARLVVTASFGASVAAVVVASRIRSIPWIITSFVLVLVSAYLALVFIFFALSGATITGYGG